ncbi:MAG: signal peptidase II [Aeoliella sp.]
MAKSSNNPFASSITAPSDVPHAARYPRSRILIFAVIAAVGCLADLATKWWMFAQTDLRMGKVWWVAQDYAGVQLSLNEGALFGMGQGYVWLFALFSLIAAVAIPVWLFRYAAADDLGLTISLACVMAGVLGNLYDRLGMHSLKWFNDPERTGERVYAVRDWILLQWGPDYHWPNFNIADSLLVLGAAYLVIKAVLDKPRDDSVSRLNS